MSTHKKYKKVKVLIFGSYHSNNYPILKITKKYLINEGFENVSIANDIVDIPEQGSYEEKMAQVLSEIEDLMEKFNFNIFIFFNNSNASTIAELGLFIQKDYFKAKKETTLVILPRNFNASMVVGLLSKEKINIFRYDYDFEIHYYCSRFIFQKLIYLGR